uniref:Uncharacterized protein n=1 Tax=Aegilops tauschii subsp. strangulata TaxID=200361 RepID=A0A453RHK8_AEGTS
MICCCTVCGNTNKQASKEEWSDFEVENIGHYETSHPS